MGKAERNKKALIQLRKQRRWVWVKAVIAVPLIPFLLCRWAFTQCYKENKWLWELQE